MINLFKKSIDKVFDRVSAFTWEKYKEESDDEENDEENYREFEEIKEETNRREFEEIKKMVLYFRDRSLFFLDWLNLSQEEIQKERESMDYDNELLQLDYSLKNLSILKGYKERNNEVYQEFLNDEEIQNDLRKWRNGEKPGFFESLFNDLFGK
ncbi:hypothetical protein JP0186_12240 [Helicobacter pylori]